MNVLCAFSFVLVALIDSRPLNKQPEVLMEMDSTSSQPDYVFGTMLSDTELAGGNLRLIFYSHQVSEDGQVLKPIMDEDMESFLHGDNFNKNAPKTIFESHGFMGTPSAYCKEMAAKYLELGDYQFVCIDWSHWARGFMIDTQARQCLDVGNYLGKFLDKFVSVSEINPDKLHFIGHSLGAHLVGTMARIFTGISGKKVARVTGLDPAGPLWVQNRFGLKTHQIGESDATFVDIIHTCGGIDPYVARFGKKSLYGDLNQLGHADFYPNGGSWQPGCRFQLPGVLGRGGCSHNKATPYYIASVTTDVNAFATVLCESVTECRDHEYLRDLPKSEYNGSNHMGLHAVKPPTPSLYYLDMETNSPYSHCCL